MEIEIYNNYQKFLSFPAAEIAGKVGEYFAAENPRRSF